MILDENGNSECAARYTMPHAILSSPREADWYDEVHRLSGAPIFLINGGGYFAPDGENNYLSLIRLINSIEDVRPLGKTEQGDFHPAYVTSYKDEIGRLQDAYNEMVDKIELLLSAKISEQKKLRNAELKILQEQIKPHFLYNSLSGIAYLITDRQNTTACDMVISLSEYYRESLSKGSEVISLATEVNIVKNYLKLQKMRFPDRFEDTYEIGEDTLSLTIPRLVLQPLVENSLYHGILPTGDFGIIQIRAYRKNCFLMLHIRDDGVGISPEQLSDIMDDTLESNRKSFGLRGTVERLQIFYDDKSIYQIISAPGEGCEIIFSLPLHGTKSQKGYQHEHKPKQYH